MESENTTGKAVIINEKFCHLWHDILNINRGFKYKSIYSQEVVSLCFIRDYPLLI